mgnify:CR=1 FL=1
MSARDREHTQLSSPNGWFGVAWSRDLVPGEVKRIRYFDEESEDAIQISKGIVYAACVVFSVAIYLQHHGVWAWMGDVLSGIV